MQPSGGFWTRKVYYNRLEKKGKLEKDPRSKRDVISTMRRNSSVHTQVVGRGQIRDTLIGHACDGVGQEFRRRKGESRSIKEVYIWDGILHSGELLNYGRRCLLLLRAMHFLHHPRPQCCLRHP